MQPLSKDSAEAVTKKSINKLLRGILTNDDTDEFMDRAFTVSAALFTTSIQFMTMRALFRNVEEFAAKIQMASGSDAKFKNSKKLGHLHQLLINTQVTA